MQLAALLSHAISFIDRLSPRLFVSVVFATYHIIAKLSFTNSHIAPGRVLIHSFTTPTYA